MPDRSVTYTFKGNFGNLTAGLTTAGRNVGELSTKLTALDSNGRKMRAGLTQIGDTAGKVGLVAAAGLGAVVLSAANFDQAMSNVQAATHETAANMEALRAAAIKAGADTKFSATEAANGIEELAKAGVSTKDVLGGGLSGALDLAAAGGLGVADAAETAATAMTQFGLSGSAVPHIADLLAAAAGKAQGEVSDMAMALKQSGLVAAQAGLSIDDTVGTLAAFAHAGLLGSDAGTSFRTMLLRLNPQSKEAADLIKQYNLSAFDAQGNFIGMAQYAQKLKDGLGKLSVEQRQAALSTIFGTDAIRAANVLYDQGAKGIEEWTNKVDAQGYAAETAAIKMNNLKGDLEQFMGSLETALIGAGEGSQNYLRKLVQGSTDAVNAFNALPGPIKNVTTGLLGVTAITGGGLWFGSRVIRGIAETKGALADLNLTLRDSEGRLTRTGLAFRRLAIGGGVLIGLAALDGALSSIDHHDVGPTVNELSKALDKLAAGKVDKIGKDFGDLGEAMDLINDKGSGAIGGIEKALGPLTTLSEGISGAIGLGDQSVATKMDDAKNRIQTLDQALANMVTSGSVEKAQGAFAALAKSQGLSAKEQDRLLKMLPGYRDALAGAEGPTKSLSGATGDLGGASSGAAASIEDLVTAMQDQRKAALSAFDAETQWRQALKEAQKQAKESSAGIKGSSDEAIKNRETISALAAAWNNQSEAVKNNKARFKEARQAFIDTAVGMGVPIEQARRLARRLLEIPQSRVIDVHANTGQAMSATLALKNLLDDLHDRNIHINVTKSTNATLGEAAANSGKKKAYGGFVIGPGSATSDSIAAQLSNGEYVVRAAAVDKYGVAMFDSLNAMRFAAGGLVAEADAMRSMPAYANGGRVFTSASGPSATGVDYGQLAKAVSGQRLFEYRETREALLWAMRTALRETPIVQVPTDPALLNGLT